jgi:hypothetical protein
MKDPKPTGGRRRHRDSAAAEPELVSEWPAPLPGPVPEKYYWWYLCFNFVLRLAAIGAPYLAVYLYQHK